ncbi:MAG: hypothetical protein SPI35_02675 [Porphyromonas sp.]|nr:hypothetical protein [Porphyromonas sp.]
MKRIITVLVVIASIVLAYMCYRSVASSENFTKIKNKREAAIQARLKKVATAENAFESVYDRYATAEELESFLTNGKVFNVIAEGDYTDEMREKGISEREAARQGLIKRDTVWTDAKSVLLQDGMTAQEFLEVPGFPGKKIEIDTASVAQEIGDDTINKSVFRAAVPFTVYLSDQNAQLLKSCIFEAKQRYNGTGYPGLALGSLTEIKTTGNWE